jgi:hypothetical protein
VTTDSGESRNGRPPVPDPTVLTTQLVDRAIGSFREVMETRLAGMDTATRLVAEQLEKLPAGTSDAHDHLRAEFTHDVGALRELIESRLGAMDKATELLAATVGRVPSDTDKQVNALRELLGARIDGMDQATKLLAENVRQFPSDLDKAVKALREILISEIRSVQDVATEKFLAIDGTFASNALALTAALAAQKEAAAEQNKSNTLAISKSEQATKETSSANAAQTATSLASQAATIADLKDRVVRIESGAAGAADSRTEQRLNTGQLVGIVGVVLAAAAIIVTILLATGH